jgi:hypothetical protein
MLYLFKPTMNYLFHFIQTFGIQIRKLKFTCRKVNTMFTGSKKNQYGGRSDNFVIDYNFKFLDIQTTVLLWVFKKGLSYSIDNVIVLKMSILAFTMT